MGIVRVERELAKRATAVIPGVEYCVYDRETNRFLKLSRKVAEDVLHGRVEVDFGSPPTAPDRSLKRRVRDRVLANPRLYQQVQRVRGRSFTLDQIRAVREAERRQTASGDQGDRPKIAYEKAVVGEIYLSPEVTIVSGGLDWEYKNIRGIYKLKKKTPFKYAVIVHDLIPVIFPQYVVSSYIGLLVDYFGELFWVVDCVLANSAQTELDMRDYCRRMGLPTPVADHFPLGADLPIQSTQGAELPKLLQDKRYALFVSTIEPRKNQRVLYEAWSYCIRHGMVDRERDRLVFVGRRGWHVDDLMHEIQADPVTEGTIVILSDLSDQELALVYEKAAFGLFPSFYEGYGLPLAEMLSRGKACLSSGSGSLKEVGGDLVTYIDPIDRMQWATAMASFFNDPARVESAEQRVREAYEPVTWDRSASVFFTKLQSMVEGL